MDVLYRELRNALSWKAVWHVLGGTALVLVVGYGLLFLVALMPGAGLEQRIAGNVASGDICVNAHRYLKFRPIDMYTECVGIGVALNLEASAPGLLSGATYGTCPELAQAAEHGFTGERSPYARYIHGYAVFLKPLYSLFPLPGVRLLTGLVGLGLLGALFVAARRRLGDVYATALVGSFLLSGTLHVFTLVTHGVQFWLVLAGGILALAARAAPPLTLFACLGAADAFVSFLSMGSLSLSLPLLCFCLACWSDGLPARRILAWAFLAACAWSVGFVVPWLCKWLLAWLYLGGVDMGQTLEMYPTRSLSMIAKAFFNNLKASLWQVWLGLMLLLGWRFRRYGGRVPEGLWVIVFPALMPLIWICLIPGQSGVKHSSFVSIILWPLLAATVLLLLAAPRKAHDFSINREKESAAAA